MRGTKVITNSPINLNIPGASGMRLQGILNQGTTWTTNAPFFIVNDSYFWGTRFISTSPGPQPFIGNCTFNANGVDTTRVEHQGSGTLYYAGLTVMRPGAGPYINNTGSGSIVAGALIP